MMAKRRTTTQEPDSYELWHGGRHEELLAQKDKAFLAWAGNYGLFPGDEWTKNFLLLGKMKRDMFARVGRKPFAWCPIIELRMPWGCTAACVFCKGATSSKPAKENPPESLLKTVAVLRQPETVALCAEWGDPSMHPAVIEAINQRIEREWLVTRYTLMTNLSCKEAVLMALPYTRGLLINFTMAVPSHAGQLMGYKKESYFEQIYDNIKLICRLKAEGACHATVGIIFVVNPKTAPYICDHYQLFKEIEGLDFCRYNSAWGFEAEIARDGAVLEQKKLIEQMKGKVPYDWKI